MAAVLRSLGVLALLAALAPCADAQFESFGWDAQNAQFIRFSNQNPGSLTVVAPYAPSSSLRASDFRPGGFQPTWYGLTAQGGAVSVNPSSGAVTDLGVIAPPPGETWTALTWAGGDQTFYGLSTDCATHTSLHRVDFQALSSILIGTTAVTNCGAALASHPLTGSLYGYGPDQDMLVSFDKTTGTAYVIGPLGFDAFGFGQAMDFDYDGVYDKCFIYAVNASTFRSELRRCDRYTGATTLVGPIGFSQRIIPAASVETSGVGDCFYIFHATLDDETPAPGQTVRFTVTLYNVGTPNHEPFDLWLVAERHGVLFRSLLLGSGTIPDGSSVTRTIPVRVPPGTPAGAFRVSLFWGDYESDFVCSYRGFDVTVTPGGHGPDDVVFEPVTAEVDLSPAAGPEHEAAAVSPNPFTDQTTIAYEVAEPAPVRLAVYDLLGREVAVLVDGAAEAGTHTALFDADGLPAGTYVYRLQVGGDVRTGRLTVVR